MTRMRYVWNKAVDYAGDVIQGGVNLVTAPSFGAAVDTAKTGYVQSVDRNNDGVISPWEGMRSYMIGVPGNVLNTLAYTGDPSRGTTLPQAQYVPTGNSVFGNSMGLDSYGFFANAPQSIGSNFYNTQPLSSFGQLMAPQYGQLPDLSNNAWYQGPGAGSMGPVPPATQAPVQAPVAPVAPTAPVTTISGIMAANKPTPVQYPNNAVAMYNAAPVMSKADMNAINMKAEAANMIYDPAARTMKDTSVSSRFDPMAGHNAFIKKLDMAKYAGELNPGKALEDAQFNAEMNAKLASMAQ